MRSRLTKYECSRVVGLRAAQLSMSAPVLIDTAQLASQNFMYIAACELKQQKLDMLVRRPLPMGAYYEVSVRECTLPGEIDTLIAMYTHSCS